MSASMRSLLVLGVVIRVSVVSDHSYLELVAPCPLQFRRGSIGCIMLLCWPNNWCMQECVSQQGGLFCGEPGSCKLEIPE